MPGPRDQLGVAVDALADALAENARLQKLVAELEHERDRLDRKRRKWKHRAQAASSLRSALDGVGDVRGVRRGVDAELLEIEVLVEALEEVLAARRG